MISQTKCQLVWLVAIAAFLTPCIVHAQFGSGRSGGGGLAGGNVQSQRADTVLLYDEPAVRGILRDMTAKGVNLDVKGKTKNIPVHKIRAIAFAGEPGGLRQSREAIDGGQYDVALRNLERIDTDELERDEVKQEVVFYQALCKARLALANGQELGAAVNQMLAFVKRFKNSFHRFESAELLGDLEMAAGHVAEAVRFYRAVSQATGSLKYRGQMLQANAMRQLGVDLDQARQLYQSVSTADGAEPRQRKLAVIGMAACSAALNASESGADNEIEVIERLIDEEGPGDEALFAAAYNALGDCYRITSRPQDAILSYLHVDLLHSSQGSAHAECLHHLAKLWDELGNPARARSSRQKLQANYAGSSWAR